MIIAECRYCKTEREPVALTETWRRCPVCGATADTNGPVVEEDGGEA